MVHRSIYIDLDVTILPPRTMGDQSKKPTDPVALLPFFGGRGQDFEGRTLDQILSWPDKEMESVHDYIQVLFPLPEPTRHNPNAPILDQPTIDAFRKSKQLRLAVRKGFQRMLAFYGLRFYGNEIVLADNFATILSPWIKPFDHNHMRISRMLKSLRLLGLEDEARAFFKALTIIHGLSKIGQKSYENWRAAAQDDLHRIFTNMVDEQLTNYLENLEKVEDDE